MKHPVEIIMDATCQQFGVTRADLVGPKRHAGLAEARFAFIYAARRRYLRHRPSYPRLGVMLGGRHHTAIMHADRRASELRAEDPGFRDRCERVLEALPQPVPAVPPHMWEVPFA